MKDSWGREITYLRLSVTDRCSLRCRYCMPERGAEERRYGDVCSIDELVEMARQAAACGIKKVRLTGGEPLVRRGILDLCRRISAIAGVEELCLTTNGAALGRMAADLRAAGVDRLNVSLDTLRPRRFEYLTRGGRLSDVLSGLEAAKRAGFTGTKLNVVLLRGFNDDEAPNFVELTRREPVEVRFIELMPIGEAEERDFIAGETVLAACPELEPVDRAGVARRYRLPGGRGLVGLIEPMSRRFCAGCDRIRITADGRLKPCLHSGEEIPLRGLRGEALRQAIADGIRAKPRRHHMTETGRSAAGRTMDRIGG